MKGKNITSLLIALVLVFSMLAGCAGDDVVTTTNPPETKSPETEAPTEPAEEEDPNAFKLPITDETVQLSYWDIGVTAFWQVATDANEIASGIELRERTNVEIDYRFVMPEAAMQSMSVMMASQDFPDLIGSIQMYYTGGLAKAYEEESIILLNDVVDEYMPNYTRARNSHEDYYLGTMTDDGDLLQIYGLNGMDIPVTYGPVARQDWLNDFGMDVPVTYEDYYNYLKASKTQYDASAPAILLTTGGNNGMIYFNQLAAGYGIAVFSNDRYGRNPFYQVDGVVKYGPMEDGFLDYITMMNQWYDEGLIDPDFMSQSSDNISYLITNDQTALWYAFGSRLNQYNDGAIDPDFSAVPITDAVKNKGDQNHLRWWTSLVGTGGIAISSVCENVEVAARWLDYSFTEEGDLLYNYGIEHQAFEYVNGEPIYTELIYNNSEGLTPEQAEYKYIGEAAMGGGIYSYSRRSSYYADIQNEAMELWGSTADNSWDIPTPVSFNADEAMELSVIYSDIKIFYEEYYLGFMTGSRPLSEYDSFVETLIAMNIEGCIDIYQVALNRYNNRS